MQALVEVLRALGEENRLKILGMLARRSHCVTEITERLGITQSSVSHHLRILGRAGLVDRRRRGLFIDYSLASEPPEPYARMMLEVVRGWLDRRERGRSGAGRTP